MGGFALAPYNSTHLLQNAPEGAIPALNFWEWAQTVGVVHAVADATGVG